MLIHADLTKRRSALPTRRSALLAMAVVERRMLERDGDEVAQATSVVHFAPGSRFPRHQHELGEKFLVLDGIFADELGEYPADTTYATRRGRGTQRRAQTGVFCSSSSGSFTRKTWSKWSSIAARPSGLRGR